MFKYLFNGTMYQAKTLKALQNLLVAAGYKGNVAKEFQKLADLEDAETQALINAKEKQEKQELELLNASNKDDSKNLQSYYDATEPVINKKKTK